MVTKETHILLWDNSGDYLEYCIPINIRYLLNFAKSLIAKKIAKFNGRKLFGSQIFSLQIVRKKLYGGYNFGFCPDLVKLKGLLTTKSQNLMDLK